MLHASFKINEFLYLKKYICFTFQSFMGDMTILIMFPFQRRLHSKFGFDWPSGFGEEDF